VIPAVGHTQSHLCGRDWRLTRFKSPEALSSWAGLAPGRHEADTKIIRRQITKGSTIGRWSAIDAVSGHRGGQGVNP